MTRALLLLLLAACVGGCTPAMRNEYKKLKGSMVGLDCTIVLYSANGDTLGHWHTNAKVETNGGEAWWVDEGGVQHHIAGTFTVHGE